MAIEIVDLAINSMVIFHSFLFVYQRVDGHQKPGSPACPGPTMLGISWPGNTAVRHGSHGPDRNSWYTPSYKMVDLSMAM